ncbi:hypothetical protein EIKCOROL_02296 [Eikenella corrodens ATCC 23834]|uniref:Uncharacterized protein n=1 Tax=Eikenella corrodens ATCC 23834 TaxID=546274 RepID=C0DY33_EIKCO|nr:hypothetical protein EIKCOROL_02296 [Eikenella corrodens ATCC 23834]
MPPSKVRNISGILEKSGILSQAVHGLKAAGYFQVAFSTRAGLPGISARPASFR